MSIYLVGAGPDPDGFPDVFDRFAGDMSGRTGPERTARIAVAVHGPAGRRAELMAAYAEPLKARIACEFLPVFLQEGVQADAAMFDGVDALVVGGGLTPAYWAGLHRAGPAIRRLVSAGAPYLGFSAGAMVAAGRALVGGYRINGVEVCGEECSEGLDAVDFRDGFGLAPFAVDVHAAQAGTLSRAVGAVAAGLVERAVAIDEGSAVVLEAAGGQDYRVMGRGNCWDIRNQSGAAVVSVLQAG